MATKRKSDEMTDPKPPQEQGTQEEGKPWFGSLMEKWWGQLLVFAGGLALYLLFGLLVWWLLQAYVNPSAIEDASKSAAAKKDLLQATALIMAGVAGAIGLYFAWRRQWIETTRQIESATNATDVFAQQLAKARPGNILEVASTQTELLTSYYRTVLAQARESFRLALIAAGIGLLFFLGAVGTIVVAKLQPVATVSIISGALIEVIAGINFYLYGRTTTQLAMFHRRLDQTQRFLLANSVCEGIEGEEGQKARASLVQTIADPSLGQ
jgi:hypothetical protein